MIADVPAWIVWLFTALFGLVIGSFLNVCIHRLPRRLSLSSPPSRCGACGTQVEWRDNVPVLSYLLLAGRCRHCQAGISAVYPIVELATMALFLVHLAVFGLTPLAAVRVVFACAMLVLFFIDLEHQILPNVITLPGVAAGLALVFIPAVGEYVIPELLGGPSAQTIGRALWNEFFANRDWPMASAVATALLRRWAMLRISIDLGLLPDAVAALAS